MDNNLIEIIIYYQFRMYISNLKLWNYRKFGSDVRFDPSQPNLNLDFTKGLNVLIGENDSGKTAIIDAIKLVLKTHSYDWIRIEDSDFYKDTNRFRIEIRFNDLSPEEAKNFTEWLGWEGEGNDAKPFLRVIYDVKRNAEKILPADVRAGIDDDGYQLTAEAREYLKSTYLKPLRDAESELIARKNSRLSQILRGDDAFKGKEKSHELVTIFNDFNNNIQDYFKGEFEYQTNGEDGTPTTVRPDEGLRIKTKIDGHIQSFYSPNHEGVFEASRGDIKPILEKLTLTLKDEENPGLGTLNRLFMAAELLHLGKENWSGIRLGLIEEIEAHIHPQAQMQVIESLQKQKDIQLILTTHSPNLASKLKLENLIICNGNNAYPMGSKYTKLDAGDYKFLERFLDTTKANLFFAKGVILVEGWAEELLVPAIAKKLGYDLTKHGVSIVNLGNTAFLRYAKVFLRQDDQNLMNIPVAIITDLDVKPENEQDDKDGQPLRDFTLAEKISKYEDQNVKAFISPHWTLEYCLSKSDALKDKFEEVTKAVHTGTDWNNFEQALTDKLNNKGLKKTDIADQLAQKIIDDMAEETQRITIDPDNQADTLNYIIEAIKYVCSN